MGLSITPRDASTFFVEGELDLATVPAMDAAIRDALGRGGPITLDLSATTFVDVYGMRAILRAVDALPSGCIILHGVRRTLQRLVELMGAERPNLHSIPCSVRVVPAA